MSFFGLSLPSAYRGRLSVLGPFLGSACTNNIAGFDNRRGPPAKECGQLLEIEKSKNKFFLEKQCSANILILAR